MNIVLDANLIASLVIPLPYSERATELVLDWKRQGVTFVAPALWSYEVSTVLRKAVIADYLPPGELDFALEQIWKINIQDVPVNLALHRQALAWAERLGQSKTYDSAYLAVAESLQAEFWTADRSLATSAQRAGAHWVHSILDS
ncbi:MAG: type II toxin-antitoxin system VapC family toxin [Chloroflexi bacterium]|nr:type II toxin-antitoxin system VapC family toxin [Chloroflexota bacterium]